MAISAKPDQIRLQNYLVKCKNTYPEELLSRDKRIAALEAELAEVKCIWLQRERKHKADIAELEQNLEIAEHNFAEGCLTDDRLRAEIKRLREACDARRDALKLARAAADERFKIIKRLREAIDDAGYALRTEGYGYEKGAAGALNILDKALEGE